MFVVLTSLVSPFARCVFVLTELWRMRIARKGRADPASNSQRLTYVTKKHNKLRRYVADKLACQPTRNSLARNDAVITNNMQVLRIQPAHFQTTEQTGEACLCACAAYHWSGSCQRCLPALGFRHASCLAGRFWVLPRVRPRFAAPIGAFRNNARLPTRQYLTHVNSICFSR